MNEQHILVGGDQKRIGAHDLGGGVRGQCEVRHARSDAARELARAEQAQRIALEHVCRAGEAEMARTVHGLFALP